MTAQTASISALFGGVLEASLHAVVLIVVVLLVQRVLRPLLTSQFRYLLWMIVLARLLLPSLPPSSLSFLGLWNTGYSMATRTAWRDDRGHERPAGHHADRPADSRRSRPLANESPENHSPPVDSPNRRAEDAQAAVPGGAATAHEMPRDSFRMDLTRLVACLWLLGCLGLLFREAVLHVRATKAVDSLRRADDPRLARVFADCRREMHVSPKAELMICEGNATPSLFGVIRPRVIVSRSLGEGLSDEELRYLFLHELAHIRRRDVAVALITSLIRCVHWFNPLVWFVERRIREDRESACDASVLRRLVPQEYTAYARTVVKVLERLNHANPTFGTIGMARGLNSMKRRLTMISRFRKPTWIQFVIGTVLFGALAVTGLTRPPGVVAEPRRGGAQQRNAGGPGDTEALPDHAVARMGDSVLRHDGSARFLDFSPDGKRFACVSGNAQIFVFDAESGRRIRRIQIPYETELLADGLFEPPVSETRFAPNDGSLVVVVANQVLFLSADSGEVVRRLTIDDDVFIALPPTTLQISRDGRRIAFHEFYSNNSIVMDASNGRILARLGTRSRYISFSPNVGSYTSRFDYSGIQVWEIPSGELLKSMREPPRKLDGNALSWDLSHSPDGNSIAVVARDRVVVWDIDAQQVRFSLSGSGPDEHFMTARFTADGNSIIAFTGNSVYKWEARTGILRHRHPIKASTTAAVSPDGAKLVTSAGTNLLRIWDLRTGQPITENRTAHSSAVQTVAFSPDGTHVASGSSKRTMIWEAQSGRLARTIDEDASSSSLEFSPDGSRIFGGFHRREGLSVWNAETGERLFRLMQLGLPENHHAVRAFRITEDQRRVVVAGYDEHRQTVQVSSWNLEHRQRSLKFIEGDVRNTTAIAISPDGSTAAIGDGTDVRIWDLVGGDQKVTLEGHRHLVETLAFSPDGQLLVTGSRDGTARVWNGQTFALLHVLDEGRPVFAVACSPDGRTIAVGGGANPARPDEGTRITFWNARDGEGTGYVAGEDTNVTALSFSADGERLVSGYRNGTLIVWNVP